MATKMVQSRILMCRPTHFTVVYQINPWMSRGVTVDKNQAQKQWDKLKSTIEKDCGGKVELVEPSQGWPDMVFTANAALIRKNKAYLSHFKHKERQGERNFYKQWFLANKFRVYGDETMYFEGAGDALFAGDKLFAAYGFRTDVTVYDDVKRKFVVEDKQNSGGAADNFKIILCELSDPRYYHIDTCFCPLTPKSAIWNPNAFTEETRKRMENEIELLAVPEREATMFACNAVVIGNNVITPARCEETGKMLEKKGFRHFGVDVSEFLKAGGACKCLTLAL